MQSQGRESDILIVAKHHTVRILRQEALSAKRHASLVIKPEMRTTMVTDDPKQAITDFLSQPEGVVVSQPDPHELPVQKNGRWVRKGTVQRGGGMGARASTITFLKERSIPHRQVHAVAFEDETGQPHYFICFVTQDAQGSWHFEMGGGGGGPGGGDSQYHLRRPHPWANLAGGGWEDRFWAGGWISDDGFNVVRVRLIGRNRQVAEDTVDDTGLVLFVADQKMRVPVQVEFYTRSGDLVGQHSCFDV